MMGDPIGELGGKVWTKYGLEGTPSGLKREFYPA